MRLSVGLSIQNLLFSQRSCAHDVISQFCTDPRSHQRFHLSRTAEYHRLLGDGLTKVAIPGGYVARRLGSDRRRNGDIRQSPDLGLVLRAHEHGKAFRATTLVDLQRRKKTTDAADLEIQQPARTERERVGEVMAIGNGLVETDGEPRRGAESSRCSERSRSVRLLECKQ